MWINDYKYTEYGMSFDVPDGAHKVTLKGAAEKTTSTGKRMIEVKATVEGSNGVDFVDRIVEGEFFDTNMSRFFDAYGIQAGNFNFASWQGKSASAIFAHRQETFTDKNGIIRTVNKANLVKYNIPEKQTATQQYQQQQAPKAQSQSGWGQIGPQQDIF